MIKMKQHVFSTIFVLLFIFQIAHGNYFRSKRGHDRQLPGAALPVLETSPFHLQKVRHRHDRSTGNKHEPRFNYREYTGSLSENSPIGTSVLTVRATDPDLDGIIKYSLAETGSRSKFRIDRGGVIYTTQNIDYETLGASYNFYALASNPFSDSEGDRVPVILTIENHPDPPYFDREAYYFNISEMATTGAYVGTVVARDNDNNFDHYELMDVLPPGVFDINPKNGIINVADGSKIDIYVQYKYAFKAVAYDSSDPPNSVQAPVTVNVIDENDNVPVFENCSKYEGIRVSENTTVPEDILQVEARDKDKGINGKVVYSLIPSAHSSSFSIDSDSGQITAVEPLDRDRDEKYRLLTVIAKDSAAKNPLQSSCSFTLIIEDINDNPPVFDQMVYLQDVPQDTPLNVTILRLTATDADEGANAQTIFTLQAKGEASDREYFHIDQDAGTISLAKALTQSMVKNDRRFKFFARVSDTGTPVQLSSTADVEFKVARPGEMPPAIEMRNPTDVYVSEDATRNTNIVSLCARSNSAKSNEVYMDIKNGNQKQTNSEGTFDIRPATRSETGCPSGTVGKNIYLATSALDYEELQSYMLTVTLSNDNGINFDYQVPVQIIDVNDNPPVLQQPYAGSISENNNATVVMTVQATDKDISTEFRQMTFSFDNPQASVLENFEINFVTGELKTTRVLDREEVNQYRIPIKVSDGTNERSRHYWISVNDQNDSPPKFNLEDGTYETEVDEDDILEKDIGLVLKVDDADILNEFSFQIIEGNEEEHFKFDDTKKTIVVKEPLDYDAPNNDRNFTLTVRVSDGRDYDTTKVRIKVNNNNDLAPVFMNNGSYEATITENEDCNTVILQVEAYDPDYPLGGDIIYSLTDQNFTINRHTGDVTVKNCLDREATSTGEINLYPQAYDDGGNGLSSVSANVRITIRDVNDNHPFIQSPPNSYTSFMENVAPEDMTTHVTIQLSDNDDDTLGNGCPCTLAFLATTPVDVMETFKIVKQEQNQYRLLTKKTLDREAKKFYHIPFETKDQKGFSGIRVLDVEVGDMNDSPMFDGESTITVYNYKRSFPDIIIGSVYVEDADDYDTKDKEFKMDQTYDPQHYFTVNASSGNITMRSGTPEGSYTIVVMVYDRVREEHAKGTVHIIVIDLPKEAVMESGSFVIADLTPHDIMEPESLTLLKSTSLYDKLKLELADLFQGLPENVDIFSLLTTDVDGREGVEVRFNVHGSPYSTASHLNGLLDQNQEPIEQNLNIRILVVDYNLCLFENDGKCQKTNCQQELRVNGKAPLVVVGSTSTLVGVKVEEHYTCTCGALDPVPTACPEEDFCLNGGTCNSTPEGLRCRCPDEVNYGPRCELLRARLKEGFAWFDALGVCFNPSLHLSFNSEQPSAMLIYNGPIVLPPYSYYPRDFFYLVLQDWVVTAFLDLGSSTIKASVALDGRNDRAYDLFVSWSEDFLNVSVPNCGLNTTTEVDACKSSSRFLRSNNSSILNVGGPLQLGGLAPMESLDYLRRVYGWGLPLPSVDAFDGCFSYLQYNGELYDMNKTSYNKNFARTCKPMVIPSKLRMSSESLYIIVGSILVLLLLVLIVLLLLRQRKKPQSYSENPNDIVKETIGFTNVEGYAEKDMTQYDLKLLRIVHDAKVANGYGTAQRDLPDVAREHYPKKAPLARLSEGFNVEEFIDDNTKKVNKELPNLEDVRHYCFEGDEMSIASLSSLGSGTSEEQEGYNYLNDWGPRFKRIAEIYGPNPDEEVDSDYEFPPEVLQKRGKSSPKKEAKKDSKPSTPVSSPREDVPSVPYERLGEQSKQPQRSKTPPEVPPRVMRGEYHEAVNPLGTYEQIAASKESWC